MPHPPLPAARAWAVTLVATATMAISYLDRQVLAVLAPTVRDDLGITNEQYGQLASAFSIAYLAAAPFAGRILEVVGVRRGLLAAVLLWTAVSAAHAIVPGFGVLFAMRLALGVAESPSFPGSAAAIARALPPAQRARGLGILYTGSSFGAMLAPPLASALAAALGGWRAAFVGVAIVGLVWVPLWLGATSLRDVRALLDARARPEDRPPMLATLRHPAVLRASAMVIATSPMFAFVLLWGSNLLHDAHGVAQGDVGRHLWLPPLLFDAGSVTFGVLASRHARRTGTGQSPVGLAAVALALALGIAAVPFCPGPWSTTLACGIAMAGGAGLFAILTADMIARVGPERAASAGGITAAAQSLAYIVANPLFGRGLDAFGSYDVVVVAIAAWMIPGGLVWFVTRPRTNALETST